MSDSIRIQNLNTLPMALPPEHQMAKEIEAILNHPRLDELLGDREVMEIRKNPNGYTVVDDHGDQFDVQVEYLPGGIGPLKFNLIFP